MQQLCLIYNLESSTQAACAMPPGVAGLLQLPPNLPPQTIDALRGAHLFQPLPVELMPPIDFAVDKGVYVCANLLLL
jgi:hypothetical protein